MSSPGRKRHGGKASGAKSAHPATCSACSICWPGMNEARTRAWLRMSAATAPTPPSAEAWAALNAKFCDLLHRGAAPPG